ncbi:hypothetical protein AGMMS49587_19960 [Spirochaetia bacterium]|nr:hypothetical protein AGMMS49587_19960 [Spirochaetia bacterium]
MAEEKKSSKGLADDFKSEQFEYDFGSPLEEVFVDKKTQSLSPLSPEEAIEVMKAGERLVNGKEPWHIAQYKWDGKNIVKFDSWYDLAGDGEIIKDLPQLYRQGPEGVFYNKEAKDRYWRR